MYSVHDEINQKGNWIFMAKKYVVETKEKTGCCSGCLGFFILMVILGMLAPFLPYVFVFIGIILLIGVIVGLYNYQKNKKVLNEEAELVERERQLELTRRRIELERKEKELAKYHKEIQAMHEEEEDEEEWLDF